MLVSRAKKTAGSPLPSLHSDYTADHVEDDRREESHDSLKQLAT